MKFRTFIRPLAVVAGLVLVLGLGLLGRLTLNTPLYLIERGGQPQPQALQFVPKQSPLVAAVLVRPDRLADLWEYLAAPRARQAARRDQERIEQLLLANTGLSYSRDIQPWLGEEVTAALVTPDLDQDPTNGLAPGYLVALPCNDSEAAQAALELYWQNRAIAGDALTLEEFSGNRLIYAQPGQRSVAQTESSPFATALVANRFVLAANHPDVLRQALTAAQSTDLNLQADRRYKTALRELPQPKVGLLALNLPAIHQWLNAEGGGAALALDALGDTDDRIDWGLVSWQPTRQGLIGHTALLAAQGHRLHPQPPSADNWRAIAPYLPDSLAVAAVGSNLATLGQVVQPWLAIAGGASGKNSFETPLDHRLDQAFGTGAADLLKAGVDRAYGVGLTAGSGLSDWLVVAPQSDTLVVTLESLTALAQEHGLGVGALDLQGTPTTAWTRLSVPQVSGAQPLQVMAEVAGLQAVVDGYEVLAASPSTLDTVLHPPVSPRQPPDWWEPVAQAAGRSTGAIYINWPQVQTELTAQLPQWRLWGTAAQPVLKHLRQITLISGDRRADRQTGTILMQLSNQ